jgi:hypothetical protein
MAILAGIFFVKSFHMSPCAKPMMSGKWQSGKNTESEKMMALESRRRWEH